jgi:cell wall-associated NlpC family hydrolase
VIDIKEVAPGDLLIFRGRNANNSRPGHTGIAHHWSSDTLYFIHSSVSKGITLDHIYAPYWKRRFIEARNIIDDMDDSTGK